jgi:hypothetical protein
LSKFISVALLFLSALFFVGCKSPSIANIESTFSNLQTYVLESSVILDHIEFVINYDNGESDVVRLSDKNVDIISGIIENGDSFYLDTSNRGTYQLKIMYKGVEYSILYSVYEEENSNPNTNPWEEEVPPPQ